SLNTTHVIFDMRGAPAEWKSWHEATEKYGRLVAKTATGELYEFNAGKVPGLNLFGEQTQPWEGWELTPPQKLPLRETDLVLAPAVIAHKAVDVSAIRDGTLVTLTANDQCEAKSVIRAQINWISENGSIARVDAAHSECSETPGTATVA